MMMLLTVLDPRVWCGILNFEVDRKVYINNICECMLTKKMSVT